MAVPAQASVVIVGGGIAGCSIAYHLTKIGVSDVVLLERRQLTCGTTWHAAGLVGQLRATRNLTELAKYTAGLYRSLEAETGQATGFKQNGSISTAKTPARFEELKRGASMGKTFGLEVEVLSPGAIRERWPLLYVEDLVGGIFLPADGQTNPIDTTQALAKGAKSRGARIFENTPVRGIRIERGRATGVMTEQGDIRADTVVLCAGMWSHGLAAACGVIVPLHAAEHFYIGTEPIANLPSGLPVLRVQDECAYYKEDAGKILLGCFEPIAKPWGMQGIPESFCFDTLPEDIGHFEPILNAAVRRVPVLAEAGIQLFFNGPESFTPDDRYYIGETPEVKDLFVATGFNSARGWPSGSSIGARRWTCPMSTSGVPCRSRPIDAICTIARSRHSDCCTRCTGRTTSTRPRVAYAAPRSTTACSPPAPVWARPPVGSARTGMPRPAARLPTSIPMGGRTGSRPVAPSAWRCAIG